jgi:hypothetical protein
VVIAIANPEPGTIAMALGGVALILIGRKRIIR